MNSNGTKKTEFGDYQTPSALAKNVSQLLMELEYVPKTVLEPNCGLGSFIYAALDTFSSLEKVVGVDINAEYIATLAHKTQNNTKVKLLHADFFETDWGDILEALPSPILILGNPPWVTNSALGALNSKNLPKKNNHKKTSGIEAITGASNFDVSEWMLLKMFEQARLKKAAVAMLVKTSVARKVLLHEWENHTETGTSRIFMIDAALSFGVSVDACLLLYDLTGFGDKVCAVYENLSLSSKISTFGYADRQLVANISSYKSSQKFRNADKKTDFTWRSGIKHDASSVMELKLIDGHYFNNLGEAADIESTFVYPMLKSSDLANDTVPHRFMLVPQRYIGEDTKKIASLAPKTWRYLSQHKAYFDKRKSTIYKNKPPFSIFGVGEYSFARWKVGISGLYKKLHFQIIPPFEDKPVVLDDTCYFLACDSPNEAHTIVILLNSQEAQVFFSTFIFWDAKRPITAKTLNKLNLPVLAQHLQHQNVISTQAYQKYLRRPEQLLLMEKPSNYSQNSG